MTIVVTTADVGAIRRIWKGGHPKIVIDGNDIVMTNCTPLQRIGDAVPETALEQLQAVLERLTETIDQAEREPEDAETARLATELLHKRNIRVISCYLPEMDEADPLVEALKDFLGDTSAEIMLYRKAVPLGTIPFVELDVRFMRRKKA